MPSSTVTIPQIQVAVGRPLTPAESAQAKQWIFDAEQIIKIGFRRRGWDYEGVDQDSLDLVVRESIADRIKHPDAKRTSHEVAVDDGRVVDRFDASSGRIEITDDLWELLAPTGRPSRTAFSITPSYQPDCR